MTRNDSETVVALEAWYQTTRQLREAKPGSAEWHRLRMMAQDQHGAYETLIRQAEQTPRRSASPASDPVPVNEG
jgi:hypothetical protein